MGSGFSTGRRRFVNWLLGTSGGALLASIFYPVARYLQVPKQGSRASGDVEAGSTADPELVAEGSKIVRFHQDAVVLVRRSPDDVRAFSATCTHLGCTVVYQKERDRLFCPCHNGVFDLNGQVVSGPPPSPLERYEVTLAGPGAGGGKRIVVSRSKG